MKQANLSQGVLVAGSINMDIVATVDRAPVAGETLLGTDLQYFPGGKGANQAVASQRAGAPTRMLGCLGRDGFGEELRAFLDAEQVDINHLRYTDIASGVALIVVQASGENSIVVVPGANAQLTSDSAEAAAFQGINQCVAQFEIPVATIESIFRDCRSRHIRTILNTAPAIPDVGQTFSLADVLVVNETELGTYTGGSISESTPVDRVIEHAKGLQQFAEQTIIVTLGSNGAVAVANNQTLVTPGIRTTAIDTTGAGDCFVGNLAAGLAKGRTLQAAMELANRAAALSVGTMGAGPSMPYATQLATEN